MRFARFATQEKNPRAAVVVVRMGFALLYKAQQQPAHGAFERVLFHVFSVLAKNPTPKNDVSR